MLRPGWQEMAMSKARLKQGCTNARTHAPHARSQHLLGATDNAGLSVALKVKRGKRLSALLMRNRSDLAVHDAYFGHRPQQ